MKETLENDPEKFYFYNNGISAICTEIIPYPGDGEIRTLNWKDFSIINGAQTTTTIGKFKNVEKLKHVQVLLKLTKAEDYKKEKELNKSIITFNNIQTVIKFSDFRPNDQIQIFLVEAQIKTLSKSYKQINTETVKYQVLLARWHIPWAYGYVLNAYHCNDTESILKKIASGSFFENEKVTFIERWFPKIHNTITKCIEKNYNKRTKSEELPSFNFKNWLRSGADLKKL